MYTNTPPSGQELSLEVWKLSLKYRHLCVIMSRLTKVSFQNYSQRYILYAIVCLVCLMYIAIPSDAPCGMQYVILYRTRVTASGPQGRENEI